MYSPGQVDLLFEQSTRDCPGCSGPATFGSPAAGALPSSVEPPKVAGPIYPVNGS